MPRSHGPRKPYFIFNIDPFCSCVERVLVNELFEFASHNEIHQQPVFLLGVQAIAAAVRRRLDIDITNDQVKEAIIKLRETYVAFRLFCYRDGVAYNKSINSVRVNDAYFQHYGHSETRSDRFFRNNGMPFFDELHFVFRQSQAALFPGETFDNYVDPEFFSDSDD